MPKRIAHPAGRISEEFYDRVRPDISCCSQRDHGAPHRWRFGAGPEAPMIVRTEADLRQAMLRQSESEHLEFKEARSDYDFDKLTDYCCA